MRLGSALFNQPGKVLEAGLLSLYIFYYREMPIQPVQIVPKQRIHVPARKELMPLIVGDELKGIKEICELLALRQDRFSDIVRIWMAVDTLAHFLVR